MTSDPEIDRLQRDVMARFKAQPFSAWPKPLLRELIRLFELAGIVPEMPMVNGRRRLRVVP